MSPSTRHERIKTVVARLIEAYAEEIGIDVEGLGSSTFDREELQKGIEPDECYYVAHARDVMGKEHFDFAVDPPPDLALEVDISPPGIALQPIYAALRVPEIWRYDGRRIICLKLTDDPAAGSRYLPVEQSLSFPDLPISRLSEFLATGLSQGQSAAVRELRQWMRTKG